MRKKLKHMCKCGLWLGLIPALLNGGAAQSQSAPSAADAHAFLQTVFSQKMVRIKSITFTGYQTTSKCATTWDGKAKKYSIKEKITWSNIVSIRDIDKNTIELIGSFSESFGPLPYVIGTDPMLTFPDQTVRDRVKLAIQVLINECDVLGSSKFDAFKAPVATPKAKPGRPLPAPEMNKDSDVIRPD